MDSENFLKKDALMKTSTSWPELGPTSIEIFLVFLILFVLPFQHLAKLTGPLFEKSEVLTVGKILILFTLAVWGIRFLVQKDPAPIQSLFQRKTSLLMLLHVWVLILGILPAMHIGASLVLIVKRLSLITLYFLLINVLLSKRALHLAFLVLIVSSLFATIGGLYEMITGNSILPSVFQRTGLIITGEGSARIQSIAGDPDDHAVFLIILSGLLLYMVFAVQSKIGKFCLIGVFVLYLINIIATGSRAGWIGFIITSTVSFILLRTRHKWTIAAAFLFIFVFLFSILEFSNLAPVMERLERIEHWERSVRGDKSIEWRIGWARMSIAMFRSHPLLGIGTGNYYTQYYRYLREAPTSASSLNRKVNHCGFLQTLAENGVIGLFIFVAIILIR